MATFSSITVNDRATPTPVSHIFVPAGRPTGDSVFLKEAAVVPIGDKTVSLRVSKRPDGTYLCRLGLKVPVLGTRVADGITDYLLLDESFAEVRFVFSSKSTVQLRKDVIGLTANMLAAAVTTVNDAFTNVEAW